MKDNADRAPVIVYTILYQSHSPPLKHDIKKITIPIDAIIPPKANLVK
jgi:hypothetical protein